MRSVRFYCSSIEPISMLDPVESGHLSRVLRLSVGAPVELFDGRGTLAQAAVDTIQRNRVTVRVTDTTRARPPEHQLILAVSFAKGQRFDWLVEKCTELGVDHIAAVQFDRTVKLGSAPALERLSKITIAAAKQCKRLFLPRLTGPAKLQDTADRLRSEYPDSRWFCGSPQGTPLLPAAALRQHTVIFIGPEGGFTQPELEMLNARQAEPVSVHPNVLRVETAAAAFCAVLARR